MLFFAWLCENSQCILGSPYFWRRSWWILVLRELQHSILYLSLMSFRIRTPLALSGSTHFWDWGLKLFPLILIWKLLSVLSHKISNTWCLIILNDTICFPQIFETKRVVSVTILWQKLLHVVVVVLGLGCLVLWSDHFCHRGAKWQKRFGTVAKQVLYRCRVKVACAVCC